MRQNTSCKVKCILFPFLIYYAGVTSNSTGKQPMPVHSPGWELMPLMQRCCATRIYHVSGSNSNQPGGYMVILSAVVRKPFPRGFRPSKTQTSLKGLQKQYEPRCEKTGLRVSDQVPHKPGSTVTEHG